MALLANGVAVELQHDDGGHRIVRLPGEHELSLTVRLTNFQGRAVSEPMLAGAGAATLSLYVLHVLMTAGRLPPGLQVLVVVGSGAVLALVGRRGPLEAALARASGLAPRRGG